MVMRTAFTIPARQTTFPFSISINDDLKLEENETFDLLIVPESLPNGVTPGDQGMTSVLIVDNDSELSNF